MAMGSLSEEDDFNPEINTTPLVDVMLVLLIIFIITIPVMNHAVKLDLPRAASQPNEIKPETISLSIDADGKVFWNGEEMNEGELASRIADAAKVEPQPELHLHAARTTQYEKVAQVMSAAQAGGLSKMGFVTEAPKK
ncbi:biopolymer transporter ExbD [uncultured Oxalicibacterium sp.]|uniref:ExbD/TolR family protein n=1 Tax=uncultured Oxalicibacterium sp. TaxID=1168540 RepID=UPI0025EFBDBC|nr:biopolymer transporter ExbD [uncultured Oxalicibacterium sp.]